MKNFLIIAGLAILPTFTTANAASLVLNGSFEDSAADGDGLGGFLNWTTSGGPSAVNATAFWKLTPTDGTYHALWQEGGYVEQTFTTIIGTSYSVIYDWTLGVNGATTGRTGSSTVNVSTDNFVSNNTLVFTSPSYDETQDEDLSGWHGQSTSFVATGTSTTIRFTSTLNNGGQADTMMDNIVVTAVPEPSSTALLGLGGLALILRRHK